MFSKYETEIDTNRYKNIAIKLENRFNALVCADETAELVHVFGNGKLELGSRSNFQK